MQTGCQCHLLISLLAQNSLLWARHISLSEEKLDAAAKMLSYPAWPCVYGQHWLPCKSGFNRATITSHLTEDTLTQKGRKRICWQCMCLHVERHPHKGICAPTWCVFVSLSIWMCVHLWSWLFIRERWAHEGGSDRRIGVCMDLRARSKSKVNPGLSHWRVELTEIAVGGCQCVSGNEVKNDGIVPMWKHREHLKWSICH